jgi:hypothetical protein
MTGGTCTVTEVARCVVHAPGSGRGLLRGVTASIPLWVPVVVAILGLIGTAGGAIAGVVITQRWSDRRDKTAWERERERERELWAREDAARMFDLRRDAHSEFYTAVNRQRAEFQLVHWQQVRAPEGERPKPSRELEAEVRRAGQKVRVYGSSVVVEAAEKMQRGLWLIGGMLDPKSRDTSTCLPRLAARTGRISKPSLGKRLSWFA